MPQSRRQSAQVGVRAIRIQTLGEAVTGNVVSGQSPALCDRTSSESVKHPSKEDEYRRTLIQDDMTADRESTLLQQEVQSSQHGESL